MFGADDYYTEEGITFLGVDGRWRVDNKVRHDEKAEDFFGHLIDEEKEGEL